MLRFAPMTRRLRIIKAVVVLAVGLALFLAGLQISRLNKARRMETLAWQACTPIMQALWRYSDDKLRRKLTGKR